MTNENGKYYPEPQDYSAWLTTLTEACKYLHVAKDFVPHNAEIARHAGKLDRMRVDLHTIVTTTDDT